MIGSLGGERATPTDCWPGNGERHGKMPRETRGCAARGGERCCCASTRQRRRRRASHSWPNSSFINHQHGQRRHRRHARAERTAAGYDKTTNNYNENENERPARLLVVEREAAAQAAGLEFGCGRRRSFSESSKTRGGDGGGQLGVWPHSSSSGSPFASISITLKLYCFIAIALMAIGSSGGLAADNATGRTPLSNSGPLGASAVPPHPDPHSQAAGDHHFSSSAAANNSNSNNDDKQKQPTTPPSKQRRSPEPKDSIFGSLLNSFAPSGGPAAEQPPESASGAPEQRRGLAGHSGAGEHSLNPYYKIGQTSSDKVTLPGDILLGGLFPIHMKGTKVECGLINRDRGIQRLEAMLYALDKINGDAQLLPEIKLGAILLDSCSSSTYALNQSLEFIRASINTVESSAFECKDKSTPRPKYGSKMIAGVIGGSYSEVSLQVANLLRLFRIPQVSYASTGTALSDKTLYDLFARTVPSDMFQARAVADIVLKMGWSYVSLVSSEGLYGDSGSREFIKQASNRRICIATHEKIAPTIGDSSYDQIVQNLYKRNATGVVLFTRAEDTRELLLAAKRGGYVHNFAWVAADGWGTHQKLVEGVEEVAWGAITVELSAKAIPGFDQYMKELTPWGNGRNPWFSEYWQEWFDCQLQANLLAQQRLASGAPTGGYSRRSTPGREGVAPVGEEIGRARRSAGTVGCRVDSPSGGPRPRGNTSASQCPTSSLASEHLSSSAPAGDHQQLPAPEEVISRRRRRPERAAASSSAALDFDEEARQAGEVKQFCSPNLRISESNGYRQEQKVQFVVDAVYAMAHALHKAWLHLCDAQPGVVCEALKELNGGEFYTKYLLNVSFKDMAGSEVKFDEHGDGVGRYNIYNFRQVRPRTPGPTSQNTDLLAGGVPSSDSSVAGGGSGSGSSDATASLDKLEEGGVPGGDPSTIKLLADSPDVVNANSGSGGGGNGQHQAGETTVEHIYTSNVEFEYSSVGRWTEDDYLLALDEIQFFQGDHAVPESFCSRPCELGQAKIMRAGDHCCWICKTCQPYEFLPDEFSCQDCGIGRWPVQNKTSCFDLPQKVLRWDSVYSLISLSVACLGIGLTLFVCLIFIRYIDTPVVKASGRELSFILLAGVAFCHLATFVLLSKPTTFVCGGQRFLVNFGFVLMYGSLLVKTNRISRIFNCARKSAKRPSFISPKSQMLITGILVGIQIFLTIVWFIFEPPGVRADSPEGKRDEVILKCRVKGRSFILSLVYNMLLITTCTIYAVKTRKIPENFNESKFIGFTMYTTIVIWLAFVTMFFGTNNSYEIQMNTMCVCISLSAYVTLFCLFSPKISIILLHPDKNVRKLTMNSATYKRAFKPVSSVASIEGGAGGGAGTGSGRNHNLPPASGGRSGGAGLGAAGAQDVPSGGPVSTTSNVLNLDAQASRAHESSVVSNVVNSNSGASQCSQKTPTTLSQQLALVGVCSNCGAHQLASMPTTASTSTGGAGGVSIAGVGPSRSGRQASSAGTGAGRGAGTGSGTQVAGGGQQCSSSAACPRIGQQATNAKILHQKIGQQSAGGGGGPGRKIKHSPSDDHMLARAGPGPSGQRQSHQPHGGPNNHGESAAGHRKCSKVGSLGRLNEMTSFTSSAGGGGGRQCAGANESISSLMNDSFMNTSLENTPCNVAGGHAHLSSSTAHVGLAGGLHNCKLGSDSMLCNQSVHSLDYCSDCCPSLCQCSCQVCSSSQVYELDDTSANPRHNSIGVVRASTTDEDGRCRVPGAQRAHAGVRAATTSGSYDAMCILQLVHQAAGSQQSDTNTATTATTTTTTSDTNLRQQQQPHHPAGHHHHHHQAAETSETASGSTMIRCRKMTSDEDDQDDESFGSPPPPPPPPGDRQRQQTLKGRHETMSGVSGERGRRDRQAGRHRAPSPMEMRAMNAASSSAATKRRDSSDGGGDDDDEEGAQESMETTATTPSSGGSSSGGSALKQPAGGHSLAYALRAAAASALGAAASQIVAPATRPEAASGTRGSGASHHKHHRKQQHRRQRTAGSGQEDAASGDQAPGGSQPAQLVGTIQASLEQVRALERARRKSMEAAAAAASQHRRKSGCFNYHDDYEYSYGLVHSDSGSDSIELQAAVAATAQAAAYFAAGGGGGGGAGDARAQQPTSEGHRSSGARMPPVAGDARTATDENDKSGGSGQPRARRPTTTSSDDDDDDFEHDGRVSLERSYSHRRRARRQLNKDIGGDDDDDPPGRRQSKPNRGRPRRTTKKQQPQPQLDEHRINSVALITATLSAGGAIVESGGSGGGGGPAISAGGGGRLPPQIGTSSTGGGNQQQESQQRKQQQHQSLGGGGPGGGGESATHLGTF